MPAIAWTEWSAEAFRRAERERRLVLLWIGATWAAAARAMEADALATPGVVDLVAERFVAVKVDSDERPDVNDRYNLGGWPTTAILTADGEVLTGGTAFTGDALLTVLRQSLHAVDERGDAIRARAAEAIDARRARSEASPVESTPRPDREAAAWMRDCALDAFDREHGGFLTGLSNQKFPHASLLRFLLRDYQSSGYSEVTDALVASLDAMADGAIHDRVGGGFHRYADAADWTEPCPDQTLEDNAALLVIYSGAAVAFSRRDYVDVAHDVLRVVRDRLADADSVPTDVAADSIRACLSAAALIGDLALRDSALAGLDRLVLDRYRPAHGIAHRPCAGLLIDQVRVAAAALAAHDITGSPVHSMLAEELMRYALRTMWDGRANALLDRSADDAPEVCGRLGEPLRPLTANCEAATVLLKLSALTDQRDLRETASSILGAFATSYRNDGLLGAPYALAVIDLDHTNPEPRIPNPE